MNPASPPSPVPDTQRIFFALWPELKFARQLYDIAGRRMRGEGRRVAPENMHLTLAFLGSVPATYRLCAEQVASAIRGKSFTLILEQMGCWSKSGILWAGPAQAPEALFQIVRALNTGLRSCGYVPETRSFAAHLTLARKVRQWDENHAIEPLCWEVRRFSLVQSHTRADGAHYEILRSWELNSPES